MAVFSHYPAAATAAVVTMTGAAGRRKRITGAVVAYSATPTGGLFTIHDGATLVFQVPVPTAGPTTITLPSPIHATAGQNLVATLASGAGAVVGYLNVFS